MSTGLPGHWVRVKGHRAEAQTHALVSSLSWGCLGTGAVIHREQIASLRQGRVSERLFSYLQIALWGCWGDVGWELPMQEVPTSF